MAQVNGLIFRRINKPGSVFFGANGGTTFGHYDTGLPQFFLGGPLRLGAYGVNEILTNQFFLFRAGYIREIGHLNPLVGGSIYALAFAEVAKIYRSPQKLNIPIDANAGVVVNTLIGPVFFGGAYGDRGHHKIYFKLGRIF
jgi:NTE family protein